MVKRSLEPLLWMLFSAGGVLAALLLPILIFLFGVAFPLEWIASPSQARLLEVIGHPLTRVVLFFFCMLALFHSAHRFRYTLYDGLQIKHLNEVVILLCYGGAIAGTVWAAYLFVGIGRVGAGI
jgi:fumarate reductase subunit D